MKKWVKIILGVIGILVLLFIIDIVCIFTINRPLFAIRSENNGSNIEVYKGLFYNTYNCAEYSTPQIKSKFEKFNCAEIKVNTGKVIEIKDTTKDNKDFACAEALEQFYEDDNYTYYWNCIKDKYMIVKYNSGFEETISNALKYGAIKIKDLDNYDIDYISYPKNSNKTTLSCTLNGNKHTYNIEYNSKDNTLIKVDNTDYYDFLEDGELITSYNILDTELTDYFTRNGGNCNEEKE